MTSPTAMAVRLIGGTLALVVALPAGAATLLGTPMHVVADAPGVDAVPGTGAGLPMLAAIVPAALATLVAIIGARTIGTLVFDLLGDLYTLPIGGGEAKPLTHSIAWEHQARFSPDGKQIAFLSDAGGGDNLWVMNADGSNPHALFSAEVQAQLGLDYQGMNEKLLNWIN